MYRYIATHPSCFVVSFHVFFLIFPYFSYCFTMYVHCSDCKYCFSSVAITLRFFYHFHNVHSTKQQRNECVHINSILSYKLHAITGNCADKYLMRSSKPKGLLLVS
uniref:Putative secreted protein n=1 Tax=Anopheles darlingi TaxID=43151 RepID=A0A2M4DNA3_ANODA